MERDQINSLCAALPGAEVSEPFGPGIDVWKIGGKIFATLGADAPGVCVKCADVDTAEMLRATGAFLKAPYFHRSWVLVPLATEPAEMEHRIRQSYDLIRASLPKKLRESLPGA